MLNDFAPAWSYLVSGVPSEGAKEFSPYIYLDDVCRNLQMVFDKEHASTVLLRVSPSGCALNTEGELPSVFPCCYVSVVIIRK